MVGASRESTSVHHADRSPVTGVGDLSAGHDHAVAEAMQHRAIIQVAMTIPPLSR